MKRKILLATMLCCAVGVNAQIKVMSNGNVGLGTTSPQYGLDIKPGSSKIRVDNWTDVFMDCSGECSSPTIYPEKDWYLQLGKDDHRVGTIFVQTIHASFKVIIDSDSTFKCIFKGLNTEQEKFKKLKPYKYHFKKEFVKNMPEKEQKKFNREHFGFKAQDVEKIYPELTYRDDSTGKYAIDYIGFIPILVEMVQDLQDLTTAQSTKIKELQKQVDELAQTNENNSGNDGNGNGNGNNPRKNKVKSVKPLNVEAETAELACDNGTIDAATNAFLFQNTPNPFSHETEIKYYVPENAENVVLYVFSLQGNLLLTKPISQLGSGSITISASELQPGMYVYTLAIGGREIDSKRMILTEE